MVAVAGTVVGLVILLASPYALALGDYAEWTYHGALLRDVLQGHAAAAYELKLYPVPNSLTVAGLGVLMLGLGWQTAAKVWLVLQTLLALYSARTLAKAARTQQGWQVLVLTSAAFFGIAFWFGFTNFLLGISFAMLICAELLRETPRRWALGGLFVLAFFSHMIPFAFAGLALLLRAWQRRDWRLMLPLLPGVGLTVWYVAERFVSGNTDGHAGMVASVAYMTPAFVAYKAATFVKSWGFVNPAFMTGSVLLAVVGTPLFLMLFLANLGVAAGALLVLFQAGRKALRDDAPDRFLWQTVAVFFVVALVMPASAAGISDPGGRMMQVAIWTAVLLVTVSSRAGRLCMGGCALLLLAANLYLMREVTRHGLLSGQAVSSFPAPVRDFGHVLYAARWSYYDNIQAHQMNRVIYPTALFREKPEAAPRLLPP